MYAREEKTVYSSVQFFHRFFPWVYILLSLISLLEETESYPMPFHYPWRGWSRRSITPTNTNAHMESEEFYENLHYKLDAWSQYDNPEEGTEREGDIHEQPLSRKTTTRDKNLLWPRGVVYYHVDSTILNEPQKFEILQDAFNTIMMRTCVRFVRVYPDEYGQFPSSYWVNITGSRPGCFSDLGRSPFGASLLNLDIEKCFRTRGHALHELLHTLGVYHEHMRPDRDQYIKIMWQNIKKGNEFNFRILSRNKVTSFGLPYDYDSVMHYSMTAFSKARYLPSIIPLTENAVIGQRSHLSTIDVQKLLIAYQCNEVNSYYSYQMNHDQFDNKQLIGTNDTNVMKIVDWNQSENREEDASESDKNSNVVYINLLNLLAAIGYLFHPRPVSFLRPHWDTHLFYPIYPDYISY